MCGTSADWWISSGQERSPEGRPRQTKQKPALTHPLLFSQAPNPTCISCRGPRRTRCRHSGWNRGRRSKNGRRFHSREGRQPFRSMRGPAGDPRRHQCAWSENMHGKPAAPEFRAIFSTCPPGGLTVCAMLRYLPWHQLAGRCRAVYATELLSRTSSTDRCKV
jgi:hypothetical protein